MSRDLKASPYERDANGRQSERNFSFPQCCCSRINRELAALLRDAAIELGQLQILLREAGQPVPRFVDCTCQSTIIFSALSRAEARQDYEKWQSLQMLQSPDVADLLHKSARPVDSGSKPMAHLEARKTAEDLQKAKCTARREKRQALRQEEYARCDLRESLGLTVSQWRHMRNRDNKKARKARELEDSAQYASQIAESAVPGYFQGDNRILSCVSDLGTQTTTVVWAVATETRQVVESRKFLSMVAERNLRI